MNTLTEALRVMATSTIARDKDAIARIEKAMDQDIYTILQEQEEKDLYFGSQLYQSNLIVQNRSTTKQLVISAGLLCSGLSCLLTIWLRPGLALAITPVGFVTGAAAQSMALANEARKNLG